MFLFLDTVLDDIETAYLANLRTALLFNPVTRDVLWGDFENEAPGRQGRPNGSQSI